jgi:U4/U6.U5 tri-snRNP component SNU23
MRVERAGVDKVKERLQNIKRKIEETASKPVVSAIDEHESKVAAQIVEEENKKRKRKEEAEARKREQEEAELETIDPEIAAAMGFGKFG